MDVTPPLKAYAEQKVDKLHKYYDRIQEIEVIFDNGKDQTRVEMIVNAEHKNLFIVHHHHEAKGLYRFRFDRCRTGCEGSRRGIARAGDRARGRGGAAGGGGGRRRG